MCAQCREREEKLNRLYLDMQRLYVAIRQEARSLEWDQELQAARSLTTVGDSLSRMIPTDILNRSWSPRGIYGSTMPGPNRGQLSLPLIW